MFGYVFMKILERRPRSYDRRMRKATRGRITAIKRAAAAEIPPGARVLDVGCGTGELAAMLVSRGATVEGFDPNPSMVAAALERTETGGLRGRSTVREMGIEGMDGLPARAYDAVTATLVLSELTFDERRFALGQAFRVLRPGGLLVVADEVVPRSILRRLAHGLLRAPLVAAAYLVTGASTRPIADLPGEAAAAGFSVEKEERSSGDSFALLTARRAASEGDAR